MDPETGIPLQQGLFTGTAAVKWFQENLHGVTTLEKAAHVGQRFIGECLLCMCAIQPLLLTIPSSFLSSTLSPSHPSPPHSSLSLPLPPSPSLPLTPSSSPPHPLSPSLSLPPPLSLSLTPSQSSTSLVTYQVFVSSGLKRPISTNSWWFRQGACQGTLPISDNQTRTSCEHLSESTVIFEGLGQLSIHLVVVLFLCCSCVVVDFCCC